VLNNRRKACRFRIQNHYRQFDSGIFERNAFVGKSNTEIIGLMMFEQFGDFEAAVSLAERLDHVHQFGIGL
jgi:hypothetical protein